MSTKLHRALVAAVLLAIAFAFAGPPVASTIGVTPATVLASEYGTTGS